MAMANNNTPTLRFPSFTEEWEEKTLGEVCEIQRGKTLSKSDIDENGTELCIHYGELLTKYNETITEVYSRTFKTSGLRSKNGDVLMPSSAETPDALSKASALLLSNVILGGDMNILRTNDNTNAVFLSYVMNNSEKSITRLVTGVTVFHLYAKQLNDLVFLLPSLPEQQKIAACLSSLDDLITAAVERLEGLQQHKKGLLQQLFPREGSNTPALRFRGFKGAWEEKTLGDVLSYIQPTPYIVDSTVYDSAGIPVLTAGKTFVLGYTDETDGIFTNLPTIIFDDFTTESRYINFPFKVKSSAIKMLTLKDDNNDLYFLYSLMSTIDFAVGAHKRYWISEFQNLIVSIPSLPEQQKIASCLSSLDTLLEKQQERIALLKTHKKGLLQQLFPHH